ncbi:unnamed protein product, partial [Ectocarpus sp. 12 AP-2014]
MLLFSVAFNGSRFRAPLFLHFLFSFRCLSFAHELLNLTMGRLLGVSKRKISYGKKIEKASSDLADGKSTNHEIARNRLNLPKRPSDAHARGHGLPVCCAAVMLPRSIARRVLSAADASATDFPVLSLNFALLFFRFSAARLPPP